MDLTDRARRIRKATEQYILDDCLRKGRTDVLDYIREFGYESRAEGDRVVSIWVRGECVLRVRLNAIGLPDERLN